VVEAGGAPIVGGAGGGVAPDGVSKLRARGDGEQQGGAEPGEQRCDPHDRQRRSRRESVTRWLDATSRNVANRQSWLAAAGLLRGLRGVCRRALPRAPRRTDSFGSRSEPTGSSGSRQ